MKGRYSATCLGQALQQIPVLTCGSSIIERLRWNWALIMSGEVAEMSPIRYTEAVKMLTVSTELPPIYVQHYHDIIKQSCNELLGDGIIDTVRFIKSKS